MTQQFDGKYEIVGTGDGQFTLTPIEVEPEPPVEPPEPPVPEPPVEPPVPDPPAITLVVKASTSADRSNSFLLGTQILNTDPYAVFAEVTADVPINSVDFILDGVFIRAEANAPYDMFGGSQATANMESFSTGSHVLTVTVLTGTDLTSVDVSFSVIAVTQPPITPSPSDKKIPAELDSRFVIPTGEEWWTDGEVAHSENIVVNGTMRLHPGADIKAQDVDESAFVGGGMVELESDVGVWVMGGRIHATGDPVKAWGYDAADFTDIGGTYKLSPHAGQPNFTPWHPGDPIPETVTDWGDVYPAEVQRLDRSIRIGGKDGGRSHVLIQSSQPQDIRYVEFHHMGPARITGSNRKGDIFAGISGRNGIHFHHSGTPVGGSHFLKGVSIHDIMSNGFQPHETANILVEDMNLYHILARAVTWNSGDFSYNVYLRRVLASDVWASPSFRGYRNAAFTVQPNEGFTMEDCVAAGIGGASLSGGIHWPESANQIGEPGSNLNTVDFVRGELGFGFRAHHCHDGFTTWQNDFNEHEVIGEAYSCRNAGMEDGAYTNIYKYCALKLWDNDIGMLYHALTRTSHPVFGYNKWVMNSDVGGGDIGILVRRHALSGSSVPTLTVDVRGLDNYGADGVVISESGSARAGRYDFVDCPGLRREHITIESMHSDSQYRFQNESGLAFRLHPNGDTSPIAPFADMSTYDPQTETPPTVVRRNE